MAIILARQGLLDALEALGEHRNSVILVGAQAVYVHTSGFATPVAEFTIDADLAFQPELLTDDPLIEDCLKDAGYRPGPPEMPGRWVSPRNVPVDFMIPEKLVGHAHRSAGVSPHARNTARNTRGIEGCLVDKSTQIITSFDPSDSREFRIHVAGPSSLLVAKIIKISERIDHGRQLDNKDSYDVYRILAAIETEVLAEGLKDLAQNSLSSEITYLGMRKLDELFAEGPQAPGSNRAGAAEYGIGFPEVVSESVAALARDLIGYFPDISNYQ